MAYRLTSSLVQRAAAHAGAPTGLRFTERQLYYEVCRLLLPAHHLPRLVPFTVFPPISIEAFEGWLRQSDDLPGLLTRPGKSPTEPGRSTPEGDLFDYALPRLLICQSHAIADMLRVNGLPMESACPVVSVDELPLAAGLVRMLDATAATGDGARVYVLHDDSPVGLGLPEAIGERADLPDSATIVPIGLRRSQTAALHLARAGWRSSSPVEIESVPPAVLLRSVHRLVRDVHRRREPLVDLPAVREAGFLTWPQR
ncbi:hypothetical protein L5G28_10100 [Gordonia sp. HY285]|uniref:hypothetical protein n=1 Tax=Gordonia liuliyuniae TaxID=2911517 RepID=UPI001F2841D8|nr:hypothetical protein [Gordonia liuliyuniae]MCF8610502.1 hypothetical protein [Gordonia liuliyuniae]